MADIVGFDELQPAAPTAGQQPEQRKDLAQSRRLIGARARRGDRSGRGACGKWIWAGRRRVRSEPASRRAPGQRRFRRDSWRLWRCSSPGLSVTRALPSTPVASMAMAAISRSWPPRNRRQGGRGGFGLDIFWAGVGNGGPRTFARRCARRKRAIARRLG